MAQFKKLEKHEGAVEICQTCKSTIYCRVKDDRLQWQNQDGTAHYSYNPSTQQIKCVLGKPEQQTIPQQQPQQQNKTESQQSQPELQNKTESQLKFEDINTSKIVPIEFIQNFATIGSPLLSVVIVDEALFTLAKQLTKARNPQMTFEQIQQTKSDLIELLKLALTK